MYQCSKAAAHTHTSNCGTYVCTVHVLHPMGHDEWPGVYCVYVNLIIMYCVLLLYSLHYTTARAVRTHVLYIRMYVHVLSAFMYECMVKSSVWLDLRKHVQK